MRIRIRRLSESAILPTQGNPGDAGWDLYADDDLYVGPWVTELVRTGVSVEIPPGYYGAVVPRSGLAVNHGVTVANAPGTIDSGYRGEVKVCLVNLSREIFRVYPGDRIAQLIIQRHESVEWDEVSELEESVRGTGGFGSTGR